MASIYTDLKQEHRAVIKGLKDILKNKSVNFIEISTHLKMHMDGEEELVYPVLIEYPSLKKMIIEAKEEHKHVRMINDELMKTPIDDEEFMPKLKVMKEMIEHHVEEEEEEIFPKAKKVISKEMEKDLSQSYADYKDMYMD
jgi:hemerythrin-like domain-containing protein